MSIISITTFLQKIPPKITGLNPMRGSIPEESVARAELRNFHCSGLEQVKSLGGYSGDSHEALLGRYWDDSHEAFL